MQKSATSYVLVNPTQVQHLEKTLGHFLSKVAEPVKGPIVLKSAPSDGNDLQSTIREICESIRKKVMQFAKDCNLRTTFQRYEQNSGRISRSEDWLSEILLQGSYTVRDLGNMANEIMDEIEVYFGKPNASVQVSAIYLIEDDKKKLILWEMGSVDNLLIFAFPIMSRVSFCYCY